MKYGKTAHGGRWHALTKENVPFCVAYPSTDRVIDASTFRIVTVSDGPEVPRDNICLNCHEAFGRRGRRAIRSDERKKKAETKKRRDVYVPRNKFSE